MTTPMTKSEDWSAEFQLIAPFLNAPKLDRFAALTGSEAGRRRLIRELGHFTGFKASVIRTITSSAHTPVGIAAVLRKMGAPDECYLIATNRAVDRKSLGLTVALEEVVGRGYSAILIAIPGRLGFYEGEGTRNRCILATG
jgi:hypothetical protein